MHNFTYKKAKLGSLHICNQRQSRFVSQVYKLVIPLREKLNIFGPFGVEAKRDFDHKTS